MIFVFKAIGLGGNSKYRGKATLSTRQVCTNKDPLSFARAAGSAPPTDAVNAKMMKEIEQLKKEVAEREEIPRMNKEINSLKLKQNRLQENFEKKTETVLQITSQFTLIYEGLNQLRSINDEDVSLTYYEDEANTTSLLDSNDVEMDSDDVNEYLFTKFNT